MLEEIKPTNMFPGYRLECYPNRDSLVYGDLYSITTANTILRGTLRYEVRPIRSSYLRSTATILFPSDSPQIVGASEKW